MNSVVKVTDKRMIIDIPLAGYKPEDVKVKTVVGESKILVKAKMRTNKDENRSLGYYKRAGTVKYSFDVDSARFNIEDTSVSFDNGLMRIGVPKSESYVGETIHPTE